MSQSATVLSALPVARMYSENGLKARQLISCVTDGNAVSGQFVHGCMCVLSARALECALSTVCFACNGSKE